MPLGPLDWTGQPFLILYGALFVVATLISLVMPALLRPAGREPGQTDADALAMLTGGRTRLLDTTTARLLVEGSLRFTGGKHFALSPSSRPALPIDGVVDWSGVAKGLRGHVATVTARLEQAGLLIDAATFATMRRWAMLPHAALTAFGVLKWIVGNERDRPVAYLSVCLVVTMVLAAIRFAGVDRRTMSGQAAVKEARRAHERLRRAPTRAEMGLGVALFGTAVLAGSEFNNFHKLRSASGDGGGSTDSSGDSDGGGGCGGGGCGGCGS